MAYKDKEIERKYKAAWYNKNKEQHLKNVRKRASKHRKELIELINTYKSKGCSKCPENEACCIAFHHRNPQEKDMDISRAVMNGWSFEKMENEIAKCDIVCHNCHAKIHFLMRKNKDC